MLKTKLDNILHQWGGVEHSPRHGLQDIDISSTFGRGWHEVTGEGKKAFTLAEVLITLGIIGVVAAMTIPTLIADYQTKSYNTAATTFERKLGEALRVMNSQSSLAGFSSTEDFVDELSKHFKINKVCDNNELMDCFEEEVFWGAGDATPEAVDMTKVKLAKNFGQKDWQQTNVVGVQFASGVSALIAYNKDAAQDPYSNQIVSISGSSNGKSGSVSLGTTALAILYDTNGAKSPNQSAKDLRSINVTKLGSAYFAEVNGVRITMQPQVPTPHKWNACDWRGNTTDPDDLAFMSKYGISKCISSDIGPNDYWAGAAELCGGTSKMANMADLGKIAAYVYNKDNIGANAYITDLTLYTAKASELGLPSSGFSIWSGEEDSEYDASLRLFNSTNTSHASYNRNNRNRLAVCVE